MILLSGICTKNMRLVMTKPGLIMTRSIATLCWLELAHFVSNHWKNRLQFISFTCYLIYSFQHHSVNRSWILIGHFRIVFPFSMEVPTRQFIGIQLQTNLSSSDRLPWHHWYKVHVWHVTVHYFHKMIWHYVASCCHCVFKSSVLMMILQSPFLRSYL